MKTIILPALICALFTAYAINSNAQANQRLSNLTSPTAVNENLLPNKDDKHDLGSVNKSWKSLYLDGSLFLNGSRFLASRTGTGIHNTAIGTDALYSNADGYSNTANGYQALYSNTIGFSNTAAGYWALFYNTYGSANTAYGDAALFYNTTGFGNTANGYGALYVNTTGWYNTANGYAALFYNNTGTANAAFGFGAGENVTAGSYNTFIGYNANCGEKGILMNSTAIGNGTSVRRSNAVRIGNSAVGSIGGYVNWSNISDGRIKKNIKHDIPGLAFINKLNPITYNLDLDAADKIIQQSAVKDRSGKIIGQSAEELMSRKEKEGIYSGFVAQDVQKAAKELNYDFSGVDEAKNENDLYGLRYADFVVPLVKAVQELSARSDEKDKKINALKKQNDDLEQRIEKLEAMLNMQQSTIPYLKNKPVSDASLEQNVPNPFNRTTTINYTLPQKFSIAEIVITDNGGKRLKQINISGAGKGSVDVGASFAAGAYSYSLFVDGKLIETRQMMLTR